MLFRNFTNLISQINILKRPVHTSRLSFGILDRFRSQENAKDSNSEDVDVDVPEVSLPYVEPTDLPSHLPIVLNRSLSKPFSPTCQQPRQAWLETLKCKEDVKLGLIDLNPDVFASYPRIDLIHKNLKWQAVYRVVDWRRITTRAEIYYRPRKKPWPQKGTGRARHGDRRSHIFLGGGQCKGPRGPDSSFYLLPESVRVQGLLSTLSIKFHQDQLRVVDDFYLPSDDVAYMDSLLEHRKWGDSVLFISHDDKPPLNISRLCSKVKHFNIMPLYGLNVWSMVKHDALVFTLPALDKLEERLFRQLCLANTMDTKTPDWNEPRRTHFTGFESDPERYRHVQ